jgi:hypothetical protein
MGLTRQVGLLIAVFPLIQLQDNPPADEVRRALLVQINRTPVHKAGLPPSLPQAVIAHYFDPVSWEGPHNDQIWGTRNGRVSGTK